MKQYLYIALRHYDYEVYRCCGAVRSQYLDICHRTVAGRPLALLLAHCPASLITFVPARAEAPYGTLDYSDSGVALMSEQIVAS